VLGIGKQKTEFRKQNWASSHFVLRAHRQLYCDISDGEGGGQSGSPVPVLSKRQRVEWNAQVARATRFGRSLALPGLERRSAHSEFCFLFSVFLPYLPRVLVPKILDAIACLRRFASGLAHQFGGQISAAVLMDVLAQPV
jgi:hypothetical protein